MRYLVTIRTEGHLPDVPMPEMNLTRRRTLRGVGAAGLVGVAGNAFVSVGGAQETPQEQGSALRVAHASPDTPAVDVRVQEAGAAGGTPGAGGGGETPAGDGGEPLVEGLEFRGVSDYQEVEPGTYRVQVVAIEASGLLEEIFGGGEEQVIYEDEVEVEEGTTHTAVAFGELARSDAGGTAGTPPGGETPEAETPGVGGTTPTPGGATGDGEALVEGLAFGEHEYVELQPGDYTLEFRESQAAGGLGGGTTPGGGETTPGAGTGGGGDGQAFQVAVLEDELSVTGAGTTGDVATPAGGETPEDGEGTPDGGEETALLRIFHAVPDVDAVDVVTVEDGGDGGILGGGEETPEEGTPDGGGGGEDGALQADISPEGGVVYSGFALGYADPEAAAAGDEGTPEEETPGEGTPTEDGITESPQGEEFEFVTVEDARDGERADGGTGGGLLSMAAQDA